MVSSEHCSLVTSCIGPTGGQTLIEQITSVPVPSSVRIWRNGVEASCWVRTAGCLESISEHKQCLEVFRNVYSELLACVPEHAQPIGFVDLRIRQSQRVSPFHDRVPSHEFEVVYQVLKPSTSMRHSGGWLRNDFGGTKVASPSSFCT